MRSRIYALATLISASIATVASAEVKQTGGLSGDSWSWTGVLEGEITAQDVRTLKQIPAIKAGKSILLSLNSPGGDWHAAMDIGKLLRDTRSAVTTIKCLSSCVMVMAGATERMVFDWSAVGVHRPFSTSSDLLTQAEATRNYRALEDATRTYLRDMNISDTLFDAMVRVPAVEIRMLTMGDLDRYGLLAMDPVESEMRDSQWAATYGLTRLEYMQRSRSATQVCPLPSAPSELANESAAIYAAKMNDYAKCRDRVLRTGR